MRQHFTTAEIAELLGVKTWQIQRLFTQRAVPDVSRFAGKRCIPRSMVPVLVDGLRSRGWLPEAANAAHTAATPAMEAAL